MVRSRRGRAGSPDRSSSRESDRLLELAEVLHEELDPIQVCGRELGIGTQRARKFVECLVDLAVVPEDFAPAVVGFRAVRVRDERFIEPRQRLIGPTAMRCFHRLIQTIPIPVDSFHSPSLEEDTARSVSAISAQL